MPIHTEIQAAARSSGATVLLPGNVYVYAPDSAAPWSETTRQAPPTPLGRIRKQIEESYRDSGVQTILLRSGDFLDTERDGGWVDNVPMSHVNRGRLIYPGDADAVHAWAFLPDLARAAEHLARNRAHLARFEEVVFPGYAMTGRQFAQHVSQAIHRDIKVRRMYWLALRLAAPFWPLARGLFEMRYLWNLPHSLQSERLAGLCPDYRDTPIEEAMPQVVAPWVAAVRRHRCHSCHFSRRSTQTSQ
jgi:nucleoside-diphosphate-sugar epimerase